jgi:hypothetical protein
MLHRLPPNVLRKIAIDICLKHKLAMPVNCTELVGASLGDANRLINSIQFGMSRAGPLTEDNVEAASDFSTSSPQGMLHDHATNIDDLSCTLNSLCDDDVIQRNTSDYTKTDWLAGSRSNQKYTRAQPLASTKSLLEAQNLCCLLRRCTRLQLVEELWLLPSYMHQVESLFTLIDTDYTGTVIYRYNYSMAMDVDDDAMYTKLRLMTRVVDIVKSNWLTPSV